MLDERREEDLFDDLELLSVDGGVSDVGAMSESESEEGAEPDVGRVSERIRSGEA